MHRPSEDAGQNELGAECQGSVDRGCVSGDPLHGNMLINCGNPQLGRECSYGKQNADRYVTVFLHKMQSLHRDTLCVSNQCNMVIVP